MNTVHLQHFTRSLAMLRITKYLDANDGGGGVDNVHDRIHSNEDEFKGDYEHAHENGHDCGDDYVNVHEDGHGYVDEHENGYEDVTNDYDCGLQLVVIR